MGHDGIEVKYVLQSPPLPVGPILILGGLMQLRGHCNLSGVLDLARAWCVTSLLRHVCFLASGVVF